MDTRTFESIQGKIDTLKQKKAKAEGAIESILAEWKKTYGFDSLEAAERHLEELSEDINTYEEKAEAAYKELQSLTNWGLV